RLLSFSTRFQNDRRYPKTCFSFLIELTRIDPQLFQDGPSKAGTYFPRDRCNAVAIFHAGMASFAFGPVHDEEYICLPREPTELTNEFILIGQESRLSRLLHYRTFSYECRALIDTTVRRVSASRILQALGKV